MIDKITMKLSIALKSKYPNELPEVETINYVHKFILSNILPIVIILTIAALTGNLASISLSLIGFAVLRAFSGGVHLKKLESCLLLSTAIIVGIPWLSDWVADYTTILTIIASILVLIYAPSNIRKQTLIPERFFIYLKIISFIIVVSNLLIESKVLAMAFFVQAITLIRLKGGERK